MAGVTPNPFHFDPFHRIVNIHFEDSDLIVVVELEGQVNDVDAGGAFIELTAVPKDGDNVTINGIKITFGPSGDIDIGVDIELSAKILADYINGPPQPVDKVTARHSGGFVSLNWDTPKLTLAKSGAAITINGSNFYEDISLSEGVEFGDEKYGGIALYSPLSFNGAFELPQDLVYLIYVEFNAPVFGDPPVWKVWNDYINRFRRSFVINMGLTKGGLINVPSQPGSNYVFLSLLLDPHIIRQMMPIDNIVTCSAYPAGTKFKVAAGGKLTTTVKPTWTFKETITVQDTRPAPGNSNLNAYNLAAYVAPFTFHYAIVKFDKNGEVFT